jgi:hypothetical protein
MFKDARQLDRQRTAASFDAALARYAGQAESWFDGSVNSIDRRLSSCERLLHSVRATVARLSATESHRYLRAAEELGLDRHALHTLRDDMLTGASDRADGSVLPGRRTANPDDPSPTPIPPVEVNNIPQMVVDRDMRPGRDLTGADLSAPAPAGGDDDVSGRPADAYSRTTGPAPGHRPSVPSHRPGGGGLTANLNGLDRRWVTLESAKFVAANRDALDDPSELATRATHHAQVQTSPYTRARSAAVTRAFVATVVDLGRQSYVPAPVRTAALDVSFDPQMIFL